MHFCSFKNSQNFVVLKILKIGLEIIFLSNICVIIEVAPMATMENYWFRLNKGKYSKHFVFSKTILDIKQFHLNIKLYSPCYSLFLFYL